MKRLLSIILSILLIVSCIPMSSFTASAARMVTQSMAVNWAKSKLDKGLDYDGYAGNQCVDLIYYYYTYLGDYSRGGNASDYTYNDLPSGWQRISVTSGFIPKAGDIAVWKPNHYCDICTTTSLGHIGIVTDADSTGFMAVNQNHLKQKYCTHNWFLTSALQCVIRPNFAAESTINVDTISILNAVYPINKKNGSTFTVSGVISSPNKLERVELVVNNSDNTVTHFWDVFGDDSSEKAQSIKVYDINCSDEAMRFASLPNGTYNYRIYGIDVKGYSVFVSKSFTVNSNATTSGTISSLKGAHKHTHTSNYTWGAWQIQKPATCTETGIKIRTCYCGATETAIIAALSTTGKHSFGTKVLTQKASSTEKGYYISTCSTCSYKDYEYIDKVVTPEAPTVECKTETSVTLKKVNGYEYSKDGTSWQSGNEFSGLTAGETYTFYQRVAATNVSYAGASSVGISVTLDVIADPNIILGSLENTFGVLGDYVKVPINLNENEGFVTLGLTVEYDSSVLEIYCPGHKDGTNCGASKIAIEKKEDLSENCSNSATNSQYHTANPYNLQWAYGLSEEDITYEGEIAVITFKVKDSAKLGNTQVKIFADQASNQKGEKLVVKGTVANINIVEQPPYVLGDVDDSGEIDLVDLVGLAQYVAKWDVSFNEKTMDVNGDNIKDLMDLVLLAQYIAHWDVEFKDSSVSSIIEIKPWDDKYITVVSN